MARSSRWMGFARRTTATALLVGFLSCVFLLSANTARADDDPKSPIPVPENPAPTPPSPETPKSDEPTPKDDPPPPADDSSRDGETSKDDDALSDIEASESATSNEELVKLRNELIQGKDQSSWSGVLDVLAQKDIESGDLAKSYRFVVGPLLKEGVTQEDSLLASMTPERRIALRAHVIRHMLQDVPADAYPSKGESADPLAASDSKPPPLLMGAVLGCVARARSANGENVLLREVRRLLSRDPLSGRQRGWDRLLNHAIRTAADSDTTEMGLSNASAALSVAAEERLGLRSIDVIAAVASRLTHDDPAIAKSTSHTRAILGALTLLLPYRFDTLVEAKAFLEPYASHWAQLADASAMDRLKLDRDIRIAVAALEREGPDRARGRIESYGKQLIATLDSATKLERFLDPEKTPEPALQRAAIARLGALYGASTGAVPSVPVDRVAVQVVTNVLKTSRDSQVVRGAVDALASEGFRGAGNDMAAQIADALVARLIEPPVQGTASADATPNGSSSGNSFTGDPMRDRSRMAELLGVYGSIEHMKRVLAAAEKSWRAGTAETRNGRMTYYGDALKAAAIVRNASVHVLRPHLKRAEKPEDASVRVAIAEGLESFAGSAVTPPQGPAAEAMLRHLVSGEGDAGLGDWVESDPRVRLAAVKSLRAFPTKATADLLATVARATSEEDAANEAIRALGRHVRSANQSDQGAPALLRLEDIATDKTLPEALRLSAIAEVSRPQAVAAVDETAGKALVKVLSQLIGKDEDSDALALAAAKATVAYVSIDSLPAIQARWADQSGDASSEKKAAWDRTLMSGLHACLSKKAAGITMATRVLRQIASTEPRAKNVAEALRLMGSIASGVERHPLLRRAKAEFLMSRANDATLNEDERIVFIREAQGHFRFLAGQAEDPDQVLAHLRGAYDAYLAHAKLVVKRPKEHAEALLQACAIASETKKRELAKNAMEGPLAELDALTLDDEQKTRLESARKALRSLATQ